MDLINIASGYLPLSLDDVGRGTFTKVVNFDPLDDSRVTGLYAGIIQDLKKAEGALHVFTRWDEVDAECLDANTNLVLAISPFGFSAINGDVDRKIASGGWVLLVGANTNRWIKYANAFTGDVKHRYSEVKPWPGWLMTLKDKILRGYVSQTSNLERSTALQKAVAFRKN